MAGAHAKGFYCDLLHFTTSWHVPCLGSVPDPGRGNEWSNRSSSHCLQPAPAWPHRPPTGQWFSRNPTRLYVKSYSGVLLNGHSHHSDSFDLWLVNSGYQYPVVDDVTLFMEAGPAVADQNRTSGFNMSSGYATSSPAFNIGSQIKHLDLNKASTLLELNSSLLLTPDSPHRQLRRQRHHCRSGAEPGVGFNF